MPLNCMRPVVCFAAVRVGWDRSCPARHPEAPVPARCGSWPPPSHPAFSPDPKAFHILECSASAGLNPPSSRVCLALPSRGLSKSSKAACFWVSLPVFGCSPGPVPAASRAATAGQCQGRGPHPHTDFCKLDEKFTLLLLKLPPLAAFSYAVLGRVAVTYFAGF